jgi:hypothetical protein
MASLARNTGAALRLVEATQRATALAGVESELVTRQADGPPINPPLTYPGDCWGRRHELTCEECFEHLDRYADHDASPRWSARSTRAQSLNSGALGCRSGPMGTVAHSLEVLPSARWMHGYRSRR